MRSLFSYALSLGGFLRRKSLRHLIVHVTNHCNFRCRHCFIDFSRQRDLKLEHFQRLARETGPLFWMDIGGGEPFLRKDLADIAATFKTTVLSIPTNGSLPEQAIEQLSRLKRMVNAEIVVSLSLDGLADTHDQIRGQNGNYNQVWNTFAALRRLGGLSLKITTVINNRNIHEIIPLMHEVRRHDPDFHSVILMRGQPTDPQMALPPLDILTGLGPEILKIIHTYDYGKGKLSSNILRNYHRYLWKLSLDTLRQKKQIIPCLGGTAHMVVWGNGLVSCCEMLEPVGDIRTQSFAEILSGTPYQRQRDAIVAGQCHCTHNCAMLDSVFFNPACMARLFFPIKV
ncbi:MAG: Elp3 protein [Magnetococcales bacterium]|nr:Elp3 protein [Magnetococcales bacterium]HIJ84361.1 radical SAM protein [Magnetococcales bacterium]